MLQRPLLSAFTVQLLRQSHTHQPPQGRAEPVTVLPQFQSDGVAELISATVLFTVFMSVALAAGSQLQGEAPAELKTYRGSRGAKDC